MLVTNQGMVRLITRLSTLGYTHSYATDSRGRCLFGKAEKMQEIVQFEQKMLAELCVPTWLLGSESAVFFLT